MRIARNAVASVAQVVISALILFLLYRAILEMLGVERLGIWSVVLATASASRIAELGLSASVTRFVAKYRAQGDEEAVGYVVQTAALSIAILLVVILFPVYSLLNVLFEQLFSDEVLGEARMLLPYAMISFVLTAVGGVFQSGLDGCQRYDWRAVLVVSGQLVFLFAALWLIPHYGLIGLAWAQIGQGAVLLVVGWLLLRRLLPCLPWIPHKWRWAAFREMLGYGLQFQLGAVAMILFEPLTKALLGKYGGLSAAGYYEMASQFVNKARALIVSANQVVVPVIAGLNEQDPHQLKSLYRTNLRLLFFIVLPLYALVVAWAPLLSELWVGWYEPDFMFFVAVLALAWCINTFSVPAYFSNQGGGRLVWNTTAHVWMGVANAGMGLLLGPHFGAAGIAWGMAAAIITGSVLIVVIFHREQNLSWGLFLPGEALAPAIASIVLIVAEFYTYHALSGESAIVRLLACIILPFLMLGPALWCHPLRPIFQDRVYNILGKRAAAG